MNTNPELIDQPTNPHALRRKRGWNRRYWWSVPWKRVPMICRACSRRRPDVLGR